ncbi:hypothetical protein ACWF95_34035 [Streptomyces vinaceus]
MPDPITGNGFDAPSPETAYKSAPSLLQETAAITRISERLQAEASIAGHKGEPYEADEHQERLLLLRRAALADRLSLAHPEDEAFLADAVQLAQQLAKFDREHDTHAGSYEPGAIEWDPSHRPYVRQEYDHWGW